ncbi:MAG TPA: cytochrome c biogenesis protein ResB [Deltaproteobacteria bacterium]|jgi:cytochrome c biogenesis protein|nr:cytochrome c biogenesis protein ResB [Deltaproteobacteria bacterium]
MSKEKSAPGAALGWLSSLKLTLVLFFALAAASVVGTLLPQEISLPELREHFGPATASLINFLALNNLYHSMWFRILLLLLCTNLVACTIERLPKTIRLIRRSQDPFDSQKLSRFGMSSSIAAALPLEQTQSVVESAVCETFGRMCRIESARVGGLGPLCAVSETGRWSTLMVYLVHLSVLIVLVGALAGSYLGFKGTMNLTEGETSDKVMLAEGDSVTELPFEVRCDKFEVSFYDTGAPKEFKSDVAVIENGREVLKRSIVVNDPLTYEGITFYQASYGTYLKEAEIELTDPDSGKKIAMTLPFRRPVTIPGTSDQLMINEYEENLMRVGQAIEIVYGKQGLQSSSRWILVDRPYHGNRIENYLVRVTQTDRARFTGLQVKKDPGIWVVWAGFTLMTLAIGLTFYSSHRKLWVCIEPDKKSGKTIVTLAGRASRNVQVFEEKFEALRRGLENRLKNPPAPL